MSTPAERRETLAVFVLAAVLRLGLFPFAENKHGDAPMRALIAERMVLDPASAGQPRTYCQFGPLHTTLMRPFIALDRDAARSSRYLSLLAGLAVFFPFLALGRRLVGAPRARLAAFLLAVSPLHLQASTTAASEASRPAAAKLRARPLSSAASSRSSAATQSSRYSASLAAVVDACRCSGDTASMNPANGARSSPMRRRASDRNGQNTASPASSDR